MHEIDENKLELAIKQTGKTKRLIAQEVGISANEFSRKIHKKSPFKVREILALKEVLGLNYMEVGRIFLPEELR